MKLEEFYSVDDVMRDVADDDRNKYDLDYVESDILSMNESTGLVNILGNKNFFSLSTWAVQQICRMYKIPIDFWKDVLDNEKRAFLFNKFSLENEVKPLFIRCRKKENGPHSIRGIMSDKFDPLDNIYIIERLREFFNRQKGYKVVDYNIDDVSMHLRCVAETAFVDLGKDDSEVDYLYGGIHFSNSEVGYKSTLLDALVFRPMCSNGAIMMIGSDSFLKIDHRKESGLDFEKAYEDAIWNSVEYARKTLLMFGKSKEIVIDDKYRDKIEDSMKKVKMAPKHFVDGVFKRFDDDNDNSLYGLINVVTNASQDLDWNKRISYERYAGSLLSQMAA